MHSWTGVVYMGERKSGRSVVRAGKKYRKETPALVLSASGCLAIENVIEMYPSISCPLRDPFALRSNGPFVLQLLSRRVFYPSKRILRMGIFIRIVPSARERRLRRGIKNLFAAGTPFVVRITGLRVEKSVAQRVVHGSTRHIPVEADWPDIENDSGRKLLHESLHQVPRLSGQIERTRTATAIIVDQLLGYRPVLYRYNHSATPIPPIYPALWRASLWRTR